MIFPIEISIIFSEFSIEFWKYRHLSDILGIFRVSGGRGAFDRRKSDNLKNVASLSEANSLNIELMRGDIRFLFEADEATLVGIKDSAFKIKLLVT